MKNETIEIAQVSNGFMVRPSYARGSAVDLDNMHVFQTFAEMVAYLSENFSHRASGIAGDS